MLLTPQEELRNCVDILSEKGIQLKLFEDGQAKRLRAVYSTSKSYYDVELLIKLGLVGIRIAYRDNPTRETNNQLLLSKLRKQRLFKDDKISSPMFPTFVSDNLVEDFLTVVDCIESTPEFEDSTGNTWKTTNKEERLPNIVKIIRLATDTGDTTLLDRKMVDDLTPYVSVNKKTTELNYGEHLVPIDFMFQNSVEMIKSGAEDEVVVDYWRRNLKVAYITQEQADYIDYDLELKTVMTEGWKDGDSPFARLHAADIAIEE